MDEAGAAERRRVEASDKVAEAETAARVAGDRARSLEQAHSDARERRASADAHTQANAARVTDITTAAQEQAGVAPEKLADLSGALLTSALGSAPIGEVERRLDASKPARGRRR
jgi:chromosome segregation protein